MWPDARLVGSVSSGHQRDTPPHPDGIHRTGIYGSESSGRRGRERPWPRLVSRTPHGVALTIGGSQLRWSNFSFGPLIVSFGSHQPLGTL